MKRRGAFFLAWILFSAVICLTLAAQGCMMRHVTIDCRHGHGKHK